MERVPEFQSLHEIGPIVVDDSDLRPMHYPHMLDTLSA